MRAEVLGSVGVEIVYLESWGGGLLLAMQHVAYPRALLCRGYAGVSEVDQKIRDEDALGFPSN